MRATGMALFCRIGWHGKTVERGAIERIALCIDGAVAEGHAARPAGRPGREWPASAGQRPVGLFTMRAPVAATHVAVSMTRLPGRSSASFLMLSTGTPQMSAAHSGVFFPIPRRFPPAR